MGTDLQVKWGARQPSGLCEYEIAKLSCFAVSSSLQQLPVMCD